MSNSYFTAPGDPTFRGRYASEQIRDGWAALEAAFDMLPPPLSGGQAGFVGGRWEDGEIAAATITGSTVGSLVSPCEVVASELYMAPSDTTSVGDGNRAWVMNASGDLRLLKNATAHMVVDTNGNVIVGDGANEKATNAGTGFLFVPTMNGIPTGTPTAYTAAAPMVYDRANNKIGVYNGSWKFTAALS